MGKKNRIPQYLSSRWSQMLTMEKKKTIPSGSLGGKSGLREKRSWILTKDQIDAKHQHHHHQHNSQAWTTTHSRTIGGKKKREKRTRDEVWKKVVSVCK